MSDELTGLRAEVDRLTRERDALLRAAYVPKERNRPGFWRAGAAWGFAETEAEAAAAVRKAAGLDPAAGEEGACPPET